MQTVIALKGSDKTFVGFRSELVKKSGKAWQTQPQVVPLLGERRRGVTLTE
jgi:hypothetical protein